MYLIMFNNLMRKTVLWGLLSLLPLHISAQVNPKEGYIITNEGATVHGTIDYLTNEKNAKACLFRKNGESTFQSFRPSDIRGYRLTNEGIYYVSRLLKTGDISQQQFAEYLLQGGVSLYRYIYEGENYFGFVGNDGKEVVVKDDRLNEDLSNYEEKLENRRSQMQQVGVVMYKDPTVANRMWKMDMTSSELVRFVKRYDERYCTSDGDCVVFMTDTKKSKSVEPHFYVGAGMSYSWFSADQFKEEPQFLAYKTKYSGIAPTFMVGADMMYPRYSHLLMSQIELSFTPYSIKASEQLIEDAETRMKCSELALRLGVGYVFNPERNVNPFVVGGFSICHHISLEEVNRVIEYRDGINNPLTKHDMDYGSVTYLGIYAEAGVNISHVRLSARYNQPFGGKDGPQIKGGLHVGVAYRF